MLKTYKTFYRFLLVYRWQFILFMICTTISSIVEAIQPYFYKLFIDAIPHKNYDQLFLILLFYIGSRLLLVFFSVVSDYLSATVSFQAGRDARIRVFKKIQDLDFAFHLSKSTGSLISTIKRGDGTFYNLFYVLNDELYRISINFIIILLSFGLINWKISAIMFITFVCNLAIAKYLIAHNMKARTQYNEAEDHVSEVIVDNLINFETVKLFGKENWERDRLTNKFKNWLEKLNAYAGSFRTIDTVIGVIGNLGLFIIILFGLQEVTQSQITAGEFILILTFISSFYPKFYTLVFKFRDLAKSYTDIKNYFAILDNEIQIQDPPTPVSKTAVKGEIEFKNVGFAYPEGKDNALNEFTLRIKPGESIAFVGKSGAGKTTVVKLLMRFFDVNSGEIAIDNINIKNFTKSQLRSFMGVVPQEPILFNNTIAYNIGYGSENPTHEQITAAAKMAHLDEFIETLPQKYETNVGERGIKLSGGQKQRLAIARMILSNPDIIIFDEATSHLDSESEKAIQDAFWKASKDKTTLVIAHRLATVVKADKIVVMENGKIVETGSHRALVNKPDGVYKRFWELQTELD